MEIVPIFTTHYSLGASLITSEKPAKEIDVTAPLSIFDITKKDNFNIVYVVDNNMCGFYEQYQLSKKENVNYRFGLKLKVVNDINDPSNDYVSDIIIFIKNSAGYSDLLKINEFSVYSGYSHPLPRIDWKNLNELMTKNLLLVIPFYNSFLYVNSFKLNSNICPVFSKVKPIFFINEQNLSFEENLKESVLSYCKKNNYDYYYSHNIYYYLNEHAKALQVLRCLDERTSYEKPELPGFCSDSFSFESLMTKVDNLDNTSFDNYFTNYKIDILDNGIRLPKVEITEEQKLKVGLDSSADNNTYFKHLIYDGYKKIILNNPEKAAKKDIYINQIKEEMAIFKKLHLVDYMLLVADFISHCKSNDIPVGPGRGSSAGSIIAYLTNIVDVDPIERELFFSRFMSESRVKVNKVDDIVYLTGSIADVDSDVCYHRRKEVIKYLQDKYPNRTSKIGTLTTLSGKIVIKEVSKILLNYSEIDSKYLSDMIDRVFGKVVPLKQAYEEVANFKKWVDLNKEAYDIARLLENLIHNRGQHASGLLISYDPINSIIPITRGIDSNKEEYFASAYDMESVGNILCKIDILGLKTLSNLAEMSKITNIKYKDIDVNYPETYNFIRNSENYHGLFQIEKGLGKNTVLKVKPKNLEELSSCLAVGRPGSMKFVDDLAKYTNTGEYLQNYELLDKYLKTTGGIIIYQEQINQICQHVYKMKPEDASLVEYAIRKKKKEDMAKWEPILYKQGELNNIPKEATDKFWSTCINSADYLFCRAHSISYAYLSSYTAYYKALYPLAYFTALLKMAKNQELNEVSAAQRELPYFGIELLPPNLKYSKSDFSIEGNNIRYGLGTIKGVADAALTKLDNFNGEAATKFDLFNNCLECKIGLGTVRALIYAGCFPDYGKTRAKLLLEFEIYNKLKDKERILVNKYSKQFNEDLFAIIKYLINNKDDNGKPFIKESRFNTIKKEYVKPKEIYDYNQKYGELLNILQEYDVLGYSFSGNLTSYYKNTYPELVPLNEVATALEGEKFTFIARIKSIKQSKTKNGNAMVTTELKDDNAEIMGRAFSETTKLFFDEKDKLLKEDTIVVCQGLKKDGNTVFINWAKPLFDLKFAKRYTDIG